MDYLFFMEMDDLDTVGSVGFHPLWPSLLSVSGSRWFEGGGDDLEDEEDEEKKAEDEEEDDEEAKEEEGEEGGVGIGQSRKEQRFNIAPGSRRRKEVESIIAKSHFWC